MLKKIIIAIYVLSVLAMGWTQCSMIGTPLAGGLILTPAVAFFATVFFAVLALIGLAAACFLYSVVACLIDNIMGR
jgi:hypothetical protein